MNEVPADAAPLFDTVELLDALRRSILKGELNPGQRLVENDLSKRYGASRGTVREALVLLANENLVAHERNRGAWVRSVSLEEALEITEVRRVLEGLCAAKAAIRAGTEERRQLRMIGKQMQAAVKAHDVMAYSDVSQQSHLLIRQIAQQGTAAAVLDRLRYQSVRYQFSVAMLPGRPAQGLAEHLAVIDAVVRRSADLAEQLMRDHLDSVIRALKELGPLGGVPQVAYRIGV
jgi:DNA-binding GntR family transcriptional regulator